MRMISRLLTSAAIAVFAIAPVAASASGLQGTAAAENETDTILTTEYYVPHVSTVPANAGQTVALYVREVERDDHDSKPVVLMIQGSTQPAVAIYDLPFRNYSWMRFLAEAGFDTFAMDLTGYGLSPRPMMDNPCDTSSTEQTSLLIPNPLATSCPPSYAHKLTTSQSDWDEIDTVVDYLLALRHTTKVNLIGWSLGGPRAGGYAALHPEKVDRLFLYAPSYNSQEPGGPPAVIPESGVPMTVRTIASFFSGWDTQVKCEDQFTPAIRDTLSSTILQFDPKGSTWGTPERSLWRAPLQSTRWGWNVVSAHQVTAPTLIIRGQNDTTVKREQPLALYQALGTAQKVFVEVACAAHQMVWENQHTVLLHASERWFRDGTFARHTSGEFFVDSQGKIGSE